MSLICSPEEMSQLANLKVVDGSELQSFTQLGWRLVETLQEDISLEVLVPMSNAEITARGQQYGNGSWWDGEKNVPYGLKRGKALGRVCRFLVGQPMADALTDLASKLGQTRSENKRLIDELATATQAVAAHEKEVATRDQRITQLERQLAYEKESLEARVKQIEEQRVAARKMERDIGRLRKALGDLRLKEILEASDS